MKIMILSDSHSMPKIELMKLLNYHQCDYYLHCGDIYMTFDSLPIANFYNVRGNNDRAPIPKELTLSIDGKKFFMCHGHMYNADFGISDLKDEAKRKHIDVVCFGHTHNPTYVKEDGIIFINPGSVTYPRGMCRYPTYVIFDTQTEELTWYNAKTHEVCNPFKKEEQAEPFSLFSLFKRK